MNGMGGLHLFPPLLKQIDSKTKEVLKYEEDAKMYKNIKQILTNFSSYIEVQKNKK